MMLLAQPESLTRDQMLSFGLLIVGVVFISAWLLMRIRKRSLRGPGHPTAREHLERYRQQDGVKNDLEGLMVEIEQFAKRLGAQLDAKSMRLEKLIDDADLRISQLQPPEVSTPPPESSTPLSGAENPDAPPAASSSDPVAADVYRLADEGLSPADIARRLDEHVGKVELILALRAG
ncbi:MAG: hypothetical protein AAFX76_14455 [Planctomycetota bacterium]